MNSLQNGHLSPEDFFEFIDQGGVRAARGDPMALDLAPFFA